MMQVYKIITVKAVCKEGAGSGWAEDRAVRTRQATGLLKFGKPRASMEARSYFFSVRTADEWAMVPKQGKIARTSGHFNRLYKQDRSGRPGHDGHW